VAKRPRLQVHIALHIKLSGPARRDVAAIIKRSLHEFGEAASLRYEALIQQALCDIGADPERPGSKERPELMVKGVRTWHLALSRARVSGPGVKEPRHFIVYRRRGGGIVEVARILDHNLDLQRHLPEDYRKHN
jgi:toxin ParE1/3/4